MTETEKGSTLLLFPAALLVVVALASITVDFARVHLAQRAVSDAAAGAANDAVTAGLDRAELRRSGRYRIDPGLAQRAAEDAVAGARLADVRPVSVSTDVNGPDAVAVTVIGRVPLAFAGVLPGRPGPVVVTGRAMAGVTVR